MMKKNLTKVQTNILESEKINSQTNNTPNETSPSAETFLAKTPEIVEESLKNLSLTNYQTENTEPLTQRRQWIDVSADG